MLLTHWSIRSRPPFLITKSDYYWELPKHCVPVILISISGTRIQATVALFKARKIDAIVISGDNSREGYNEPEDMQAELLKEGIPKNKIYLDYAGFRTLDSVVRMEKIFAQSSFTVISQDFHNRRAIYIAQARDLQVVGFNAEDVNAYSGFKTQLREKFARVKLFLDLYTNKSPKYLGEKIIIK